MYSPLPRWAAWFAALIFVVTMTSVLHAQINSTNIAGSGNELQATASNAAIISGSTSTNGGTNSAIIGAGNSIVPGVRALPSSARATSTPWRPARTRRP
jgi:hypothetical protein